MIARSSIALAILTLAAPVCAQQQTPTASATAAPAKEKKFCRREVATGSMMPGQPVCHTKAEWNQIDSVNSDNAQNALSQRSGRLNGR